MTIIITPEIIAVFILCIIASFLFGFVAGISLEYHTSNQAMERRLATEAERFKEIGEMAHFTENGISFPSQEAQP